MKITAGLGSIDDYIAYVKAGAEELFCGYVPGWWSAQYSNFAPLNRREVLYYNVQIGSASEMEILREMIEEYQVPVSITLNALSYLPEQYPQLERYIEECLRLGFSSFIIADMALLVYLQERGITGQIQITVSGELGEMNEYLMSCLQQMGVRRVIFHRKMTPQEMKQCIGAWGKDKKGEFEAFAMNENCHFHGGFCNSLHCDELTHICRVPYRLKKMDAAVEVNSGCLEKICGEEFDVVTEDIADDITEGFAEEQYRPGSSGCGLCAFWCLREAGITNLKIVGRGNYTEEMRLDIRAAVKALEILASAESEREYISRMKKEIFPEGCSGNCYYRDSLFIE